MFDLTGQKALVTGATGGIGADIAKKLHAAGAEVVISGTRENVLQELAAEIAKETGSERVHVVPAKLNEPESITALAAKAEEIMGQVDILVNNAGITKDTLMMRMSDEDFESVLDINLTSAFRLTKALLRGMMKRKAGRIINITSIVGVTGNAGQVNYAASKAGMIGMSKSLAQEVASRGITVNCIAPGFIETPMTDKLNDEQKAAITKSIPAGTLGQPEDISTACVYLASAESRYMTGQTLHVNGGMAMI